MLKMISAAIQTSLSINIKRYIWVENKVIVISGDGRSIKKLVKKLDFIKTKGIISRISFLTLEVKIALI